MAVFLALLAVLVPASVTLAGYWLKQQSEKRLAQEKDQSENRLRQEQKQSEERLEQERKQEEERLDQERKQEEERLDQERKQENDRLRLDAAIRAAELFARPSDDGAATAAKSASGLLALTRLDFVDLAVALLVDLWSPEGSLGPSAEEEANSVGVSTETAIQVINAALKGGGPDARIMASELLCRHAHALDICNSLHWPSSVNSDWISELPVKAKFFIIDALVHMALASKNTRNALRELAVRLYTISTRDSESRVKGCVGMLMKAIIDPVEHLGYTDFMTGPGYTFINIEQMKQVAAEGTHHPDGYFEMIVKNRSDQLTEWAKQCSAPSFAPGMLATAS